MTNKPQLTASALTNADLYRVMARGRALQAAETRAAFRWVAQRLRGWLH